MSNTEASNVALPIAGYRSGTVALLGSANAGKSSIMNALVAKKISAVSPKPQTTRNRIVGVKHRDDGELIIVDSPGFEGVKRNGALAQLLKRQLREAGSEIDYVAFVIDAEQMVRESRKIAPNLAAFEELGLQRPNLIVLNKCDRLNQPEVPALIARVAEELAELGRQEIEIIPVSARTGRGLPQLEELLLSHLPVGERAYPDDSVFTQSEDFLISEIVREKVFSYLEQELPYVTAVIVDGAKEEREIFHISASICVERESQKGIVIGKKGEMLKKIGSAARVDLEALFEIQVFLQLHVKVENDWTKSDAGLRRAGYQI